MLIGEVSELVGLSPKTIRYYEAEGVIPAVARQANGYRTYDEVEVRRLRMVAAARALDLPLEDISDLSDLISAGRPPCARLRSVAEQRRSTVRRMIHELNALEERLTETIALTTNATNTAVADTHFGCPVLEATRTNQP